MKGTPSFGTAALVTFVTIVVWALAETQTLRTELVTASVSFAPGSPDLLVRVAPNENWPGSVELELSGPAGSIDRLRERLASGIALTANREISVSTGRQTIDLRDTIRRNEAFSDAGVAIVRSSPERVAIEMERVEVIRRPVALEAAGAQLRGTPTITPAEVEVRVAAQAASLIPEFVIARPPADRIASLTPGVATTIEDVPVEVPGVRPWGLSIAPARVAVTMELRTATDSIVFPALPVRVLLPSDAVGKWAVEIAEADRFLRDVRVTGPAATINQWRQREFEPVALITLRGPDLETGGGTTRAALIQMPASFTATIEDADIAYTTRRLLDVVPAMPAVERNEDPPPAENETTPPPTTDPGTDPSTDPGTNPGTGEGGPQTDTPDDGRPDDGTPAPEALQDAPDTPAPAPPTPDPPA
ncbi:MAG: hypothetical protein AAGI17_08075, partial [Planctomycetota bacterium]